MTKIFLTGATGYVGGEALYNLVDKHPEYTIRALLRNPAVAKEWAHKFSNVHIVEGNLDDAGVLTREVAQADIVLNLAAAGHLESVQAISEAFENRPTHQNPAHWVQISGATALAADELADKKRVSGSKSDVIFDDVDGIDAIREIIRRNPSREVDNFVLSVATDTTQVNTALIYPPIIYGQGRGPGNQRSIQIPELARATLRRGRGLQVGKGLSRWGNVHVHDIGQLVLRLVERAVEAESGDEQIWNLDGIFLTGVGESTFGEISKQVATSAAEKGFIKSGDVIDELLGDEANKALADATVLFGTNARSRARRARELLRWKPEFGSDGLAKEIPQTVEREAEGAWPGLGFLTINLHYAETW